MGAVIDCELYGRVVVSQEYSIPLHMRLQYQSADPYAVHATAAHSITATGQVLTSIGDHATAGRVLAQHPSGVEAHTIAVGRSPRGPVTQFTDGSLTATLTHAASCNVVLLEPGQTPHQLTAASLEELRTKSA